METQPSVFFLYLLKFGPISSYVSIPYLLGSTHFLCGDKLVGMVPPMEGTMLYENLIYIVANCP